jgi:hypothetical protein
MSEILIIPDIHGRKFWEPALHYSGRIVFLGDYLDPYPSEGITPDAAYDNFLRIVEFKTANPDRVTLLLGNHDLHYIDHKYECARFSPCHYMATHEVVTGDMFQVCKQAGNHLFSHAGVLKDWHECHSARFMPLGVTLEERINRYFRANLDAFGEVSALRGGQSECGSPLWADIHEHFDEPAPFAPDIIQIIGHTQMDNPETYVERNICLTDNRRVHILKNNKIVTL